MLIVHIGLPKTGTTFLQKNILARAPGISFVHRLQGPEAETVCLGLRRHVRAGTLGAAWQRRRLRRQLARFLAEARTSRSIPVLSAENISVHSVLFWRGSDPAPEVTARRLADLLAPLAAEHGPARIVIGLREQAPWLASRYAESGKDCKGFDQADFDRRLREIARSRDLSSSLKWLDHLHVYERFAEVFEPQNLHVFFQEQLDAKPGRTLADLGRFIGGEELGLAFRALGRQSSGDRRNVSARGSDTWRLKTGPRQRLVLAPELRAAIEARFAASNLRLQDLLARQAARRTPPCPERRDGPVRKPGQDRAAED